MKKTLKVLSAVLVASFALANVVSAEITVQGDKPSTSLETLLDGLAHKPADTKLFYESLINDKAEAAALKELGDALKSFENDVKKVSKYSQALCGAKKDLIEADKEIKKAALYTQLAGKLVQVKVEANTKKANVDVPETVKFVLKADLEALNEMDKKYTNANGELKKIDATKDILGNDVPEVTVDQQKEAIAKDAAALVKKISDYQEEAKKAFDFEAKTYEKTVAGLREKAAVAAAKVKLIQEFGKRLNVTFLACEFEDPFEMPKAKTEEKKAEEKKDSVPNTAAFNFFPQLPTTCQYAIVSEGEGCCKVFKVVKACDLKAGKKSVAMSYADLASYSIPALACSCK